MSKLLRCGLAALSAGLFASVAPAQIPSATTVSQSTVTTTTLLSSASPSVFGQAITLTASVSPAAATGKVTFYEGTSVLGIGTLTGGVAHVATSLLPAGRGVLKAYYAGDLNHAPSLSALIAQTVNANPSGTLTPAAGSPFGAGTGPVEVAVGDFNVDGIQDLAVLDLTSGDLTVLLGNGSAGFNVAPGGPFPIGISPENLTVGDFNGDGLPDLAFSDLAFNEPGTCTEHILLGNGSGGFSEAPGSPFGVAGIPVSVAASDFNGDGIQDIAVLDGHGNNVAVLLGNGSGGFSAALGSPFPVGTNPKSVVAGDFNGDGVPDLAIATDTNALTVLLGTGSGSFSAAPGSPSYGGNAPHCLTVADFNGDGILDLVTTGLFDHTATVLLGTGTGAFNTAPGSPFFIGEESGCLAVADLNGDGIPDLAIGASFLSVWLGNGSGGFSATSPNPLIAGTATQSVAVGDFDGDGRTDVAVVNYSANDVTVLLGRSAATGSLLSTTSPASITVGTAVPLTLTVSDMVAGFNAPTGTATFSDGSTILGTATQSTSPYSFSAAGLAVGTHTLTASYSGDSRSAASASNSVTITVNPPPPAISSLAPSSARAGGSAFTLTVNGTNFISGATVKWGATALTTTFVSATELTAPVTAAQIASAGPMNVTVVNPGTVTSNASVFTVNSSTVTTTTLLSSASPSVFGQAVTLTANVSPAAATGKVTFYEGASVIGIGPLVGGVGHVTTSVLPSGRGTLKAYYAGDANYAPSTSGPAVQTVNANPSGTLTRAVGSPISVGTNPVSVAAGDFNGDGIQDLAIANSSDNNVTILLGNGLGGFSAAPTSPIAAGIAPSQVVVGDFNGDGLQDLAFSNGTILIGNGSGGFSAAPGSPVPAGTSTESLAVGDFNGDGVEDLAFANGTILLGSSSGTFSVASGSPIVAPSAGVVVGDFNGDGVPDLVFTNPFSSGLTIMLGDGTGGFNMAAGSPGGTVLLWTAVADLNGDGIQDLIVANGDGVMALLGNGAGGFSPAPGSPTVLPDSDFARFVAVGDLNGDGLQDVVVANNLPGASNATVLLGDGTGRFSVAPGAPFSTGNGPASLVIGDFNGDGRPDVATTNYNDGNVTVLLGGPAATGSVLSTTSPASITAGTVVPLTLAVSEAGTAFNAPTGTATFSDGSMALGTATQTTSPYSFSAAGLTVGTHTLTASYSGDSRSAASASNSVTITVNPPPPTISSLAPSSARAGGVGFTLTVNGTNFVSGATVDWGATALSTTFVSATQLTASVSMAQIASAGPVGVTVVNPGPVTSNASTFTVNPSTVSTIMLISSASPSVFGQAITLTATVSPPAATGKVTFYEGASVLGIGTMTGGVAQLRTSLLPSGTGTLKAYYGGDASYAPSTSGPAAQTVNANPSGTLVAAPGSPIGVRTTQPSQPAFFTSAAVGDFNGDGIQDVAMADDAQGNVTILLGNGAGGFTEATGSPFAAAGAGSVVVGDFNGDGIMDLATANFGANNVTVLLGNGSGGFSEAAGSPFAVGTNPGAVVAGDFNGDGILDLATANAGTNNVTILLGNGSGGFSTAIGSPFAVGTNPRSLAVGDFNGDGIQDLAVANIDSNNLTILLGNGSGGFSAAAGGPFAVGTNPWHVAVGDFNGDGIPDLATANGGSNDITVLLGSGSGGFSAATGSPFAVGPDPQWLAVGDFNGDGIQDLAVATLESGNVTVLLGNGSGGFSAATGSPFTGTNSYALAVGDFNGDGRTDLVAPNYNGRDAAILLGESAATNSVLSSTSPASIPFGTSVPLTLALSDRGTAFNTPTGTVTFSDGPTVLGVATQTTSPYTFNATGLAVGTHTLTATYSGDTRSSSSASIVGVEVTVTSTTPTISGLSPLSGTAGGPAFTLTVSGTNFVAGSTVQWGATPLATTFVGATQVTAAVPMALIAVAGTVNVTVVNPGALTSTASTFTILAPTGQTWTQLMPTGGPPAPRNGASAVFDPETTQMISFGGVGVAPGNAFLNDAWSLNTTTNQWTQLSPAGMTPPGRSGVSSVYDSVNSRITIFGGDTSSGCVNDVWTLSNANGLAGTPAWTQLSPAGPAPVARTEHRAIYDPGSNRMIVFGGIDCNESTFYNDVWVLTNANGLGGTPAWIQLAPAGVPPGHKLGFSAVYDPISNEMIVFGGDRTADILILSHANGLGGTPMWTELTPAGATIPSRYEHTAVYDPASNRMTVFGGGGSGGSQFNDTWVLTNANNSGGTPAWTQLAPSGTIPPARQGQTAVLDPTTNRMIVFGGDSNFTWLNDVWALSGANNVTPSITSLSPNSATAGGAAFTLTVNGQGFTSGAVVKWNGAALTTTFVNSTQLTAPVTANLIAAAGTAHITVVNPGGAASAAATFTINSAIQPLSITSGTPPNGMVNVAYGPITFTASGGSGGYLWSASGVPGLTINGASGVLSGTPTAPGNLTLTVTLTDANNLSSSISQNYAVTIAAAGLAITTSSLPSGIQNQPYSASLTGSGGSGTYNWAISGIPGLTVNASTGAVSGSPTIGGNLTLNVTLSDALNVSATAAMRQYAVTITFAPLTITTPGALGEFAPNAAISKTFAAIGGSPAFTWSATGVPTTLTLNPATGQITGNAPATPGNYSFPLKVSDAESPVASDSTTVTFSVLGITTSATLPSGTTATAYSLNFVAAGGTPPYTFSSPSVPAGLTLSSSGFLSGTPAKSITSSFQVLVTDASGIAPVSSTFSLTVGTGVQPIQVTGAALPDGALTTSYSQPLEAQNGQPSYNWTVLGGALPPGLALSSSGTISGTPTATGTATFTARATDSAGGFASGVFSINVKPASLQITAAALPNAMVGLPYGAQPINATGGFPPYTFAITQGSLPSPLTFGSGQINSGVPATAGSSSFTVTATDSIGNTASGSFTLLVEPTHPDLILSQGSVSFSLVTGAVTLPAAANVTVGSSVAASLGYNILVNPPAPWLDVTPNGSTPGAIIMGLDAANAPPLGTGIYQTTVTVSCPPFSGCSGGQNIAVSLAVTSPAPQLSVGTNLLSFSATGNSSQTLVQPLNLQNSGGGVVTIQSVSAADSWVKFDPATIPPPPVPLAAGQTLQVNVFADTTVLSGPGYYQSTITVTTDAGSATVPVTLLIAANGTIGLSPAGSQYNTVAGNAPGSSNGSFLVTVSGNSTVNWTAAILPASPAANWLTLNTPSGSSTSSSPGAVSFSINGAAAGLAARPYYATIEITATGSSVTDPVQDYQLVLNVAPAGDIGAPNPDPPGLIFISTEGGALPAQVVEVGSSSGGTGYTAKSDSPSWLSVTPALGTTSSASPGQSSVSVNTAGLVNGVYHGGVNYAIAGQVRTVNVTLIMAVPAAEPTTSGISGKAASPGCTATQIIPTQTGLVNNFSLPTAWPTPLQINVVDDCGKAVTTGQVVATFSNGDPPLVLPGVGGSAGVYAGTWTPRATASQVTISAQASAPGFKPAAVQITGQVTRNGAPVLNLGGSLNAFVPEVGSPLAPGMIVQIYGSNLASQTAVSSVIPLSTSLNNTSVIIGGILAPLYFVSPGQINAQVPFELAPGASYQVIVNANGALSTPNPIQLASDAPGIAAFASGGIIAQHGDGSLVTDEAPAAPGEYIVFYVSGMGLTSNQVTSGQPSPGSPNLAQPTDPPTLTLNGTNVPIYFAGLTPTLVGLYQVNFEVPVNTPNGDLQLVLTQTGGQSNSTILAVHN